MKFCKGADRVETNTAINKEVSLLIDRFKYRCYIGIETDLDIVDKVPIRKTPRRATFCAIDRLTEQRNGSGRANITTSVIMVNIFVACMRISEQSC